MFTTVSILSNGLKRITHAVIIRIQLLYIDLDNWKYDEAFDLELEEYNNLKEIEDKFESEAIDLNKTKENSYFHNSIGIFEELNNEAFFLNSPQNELWIIDNDRSLDISNKNSGKQDENKQDQINVESDIKEYSDRKDVIYKNLLRGTRRYLWKLFR